MNQKLARLAVLVDALTLRERAAIGAAALLVLWGGWTLFSWDGIEAERVQAEQRLVAARDKLTDIAERANEAAASSHLDPDLRNREERDRLLVELDRLDRQLAEHSQKMITPEQMVGALRELLAEQRGLSLERFELLAPSSAIAAEEEPGRAGVAEDALTASLYKHAIEIEWVGGYLETLRYLRAVERLGWALYWERLDYEVIAYPDARVRLRLFTLSEQEDWIGV